MFICIYVRMQLFNTYIYIYIYIPPARRLVELRIGKIHRLKCRGDWHTLSEGFVWINVILFNQLAEFWLAYLFPGSLFSSQLEPRTRPAERDGSRRLASELRVLCCLPFCTANMANGVRSLSARGPDCPAALAATVIAAIILYYSCYSHSCYHYHYYYYY